MESWAAAPPRTPLHFRGVPPLELPFDKQRILGGLHPPAYLEGASPPQTPPSGFRAGGVPEPHSKYSDQCISFQVSDQGYNITKNQTSC